MRGQVTIYVILGIVIVTTLIGVFVLKDYVLKSEFEREVDKFEIGGDFIPVYNSYRNCVNEITNEGISIIASQGGYLDIPNYESVVNPLIPFSNKLQIFGNDLEVPYWFYEKDNGVKEYQILGLNDIESNLETYVENNLDFCLDDFSNFPEYVFDDFSSYNVNIEIEEDKVYVEVGSSLIVEYKELTQNFNELRVVVDSSLGGLYNKALEVYNNLYNNNFLEEKTIDMLVLYQELPFIFTDFDCERKIWNRQEVNENFKRIISLNTNKYNFDNDDYYSLDIPNEDYGINFNYNENWPFYMDVGPSEGNILKGESMTKNTPAGEFVMGIFCINDYHFIYDVKYPVLIKLNKNNLNFMFGYQVILDNNQPKDNLFKNVHDVESEVDLCLNKNSPLKINTYYLDDNDDVQLLSDVNIKFKCFDDICQIGESINGVLEDDFPSCYNGLLSGDKEGYYRDELLISSNNQGEYYLFLDKVYDLNLEVKLIDKDTGNIKSVNDEDVFLIFEGSRGYKEYIDYSSTRNIKLIDDVYNIQGYVNKEGKVNIEKTNLRECVNVPREGILGLVFKKEKCIDVELGGFDLDSTLVGGNKFEIEITKSDLLNDKIVIYLTIEDIPDTQEEILDIYNLIEGGILSESFRYPEYE